VIERYRWCRHRTGHAVGIRHPAGITPVGPKEAQMSEPPAVGRAPAPPPKAWHESTDELPVIAVPPLARMPRVSWQRPSHPGLRILADGWGLSALGLLFAFCGWGTWAAAGRGTLAAPVVGFMIVLVVAGLIFLACRLVGRVLFQPLFGRPRRTARVAHGLVGLFLTIVGTGYLTRTSWIMQGLGWLRGIR
jgi:eukaryotic-like serine/threonine-protein kinase